MRFVGSQEPVLLNVNLSINGLALKREIIEMKALKGVEPRFIRLVCFGAIIGDEDSLLSFGLGADDEINVVFTWN